MGVSLEFKGGAHVVGEVAEVLRIGREPRSYGNAVGESVASARRNGSGASVPAHADRDVEFLDVVRLHQASEAALEARPRSSFLSILSMRLLMFCIPEY